MLGVPSVAVRGHWVKHTYPGSAPLPEREPPPDNRWQRGEVAVCELSAIAPTILSFSHPRFVPILVR